LYVGIKSSVRDLIRDVISHCAETAMTNDKLHFGHFLSITKNPVLTVVTHRCPSCKWRAIFLVHRIYRIHRSHQRVKTVVAWV